MELRTLLAETLTRTGLHPLTAQLITGAIRRYEDAGAQLLHQILGIIGPQTVDRTLPRRSARLLQRCVETFQYATLASLNSRRLATVAFGLAGNINDVLAQLTTIANVQEARRDSGLSAGKGDPNFLRQVKRPAANPDVDFRLYALQEAVKLMPVRRISRDQRIALADTVASLAVRSDGWTAAGAVTTLIHLGALKYAVDVVDHIPANDPTRSEGVIALVRGLWAFGDTELAQEQVDKALAWVKSFDGRNPERATIWGLAEVYFDFGRPDLALRLLDHRVEAPAFAGRMRKLFQNAVTDDELRDNRLRLHALIMQNGRWSDELQAIYQQLEQWAPRLLDGEALINFYADGLLRPLLSIGKVEPVWTLLPPIRKTLGISSGDKHAAQVLKVSTLLADYAAPKRVQSSLPAPAAAALPKPDATAEGEQNGSSASEIDPGATDSSVTDAGSSEASAADAGATPAHGADSSGVLAPELNPAYQLGADAVNPAQDQDRARTVLERFIRELWEADAYKGIWQIVRGIEGGLPLLLALEGPEALVTIAQVAAEDGGLWSE